MKKRFDVLRWVRQVRDSHHEAQKGLTTEQKIARTKAEARQFRSGVRRARVSGKG